MTNDQQLELLQLKSQAFDLIQLHEHAHHEDLHRFFLENLPDLAQYQGLVIVNPNASTTALRDFVWTKLYEVNEQIAKLTSREEALDLDSEDDQDVLHEETNEPDQPDQPVEDEADQPSVPATEPSEEPESTEEPEEVADPLAEILIDTPQERTI